MPTSLSPLTFRQYFVGLIFHFLNAASINKKKVLNAILLFSVSLVLTACGGGGGSSDTPGPSDSTSTVATGSTISGTAATGAAISGQVFIYGSGGGHESFPIDASGHYEIDVSELTAPFIIIARPDAAAAPWLYSFASKSGVVANVTPLTNLALYLAYGKVDFSNLLADLTTGSLGFSMSDLEAVQTTIKSKFSTKISELGLDPNFDFFSMVFNTNGTGLDGLLDYLIIDIDMAGAGEITINGTVYNFSTTTDDGTDPTSTTDLGSLTLTGNFPDNLDQHTFSPDSFEVMPNGTMKWTQGAEADGINLIIQVVSGSPVAFIYNNGVMTETAGDVINPVSGLSMNATSVKFTSVISVSGLTTLNGKLNIAN
jgi:hypothetical protein